MNWHVSGESVELQVIFYTSFFYIVLIILDLIQRITLFFLMRYILLILFLCIVAITVFLVKSMQLPAKLRKAEEYIDEEEYSKASAIIKRILDKKKDYAPARYIRAKLLMRQKQYLMAISELNSIQQISDFNKQVNELDLHYHLAMLYNETRNWQKEIDEYHIILTFNPDDLQGNYRIGQALFRQKDYKRVKEHLMKVVIMDPARNDCYLPLGVSCYQISDYEKAEQYLLKALENPSDNLEASFYLGSIYKMKKDYINAVEMLEMAKKDKRFFTQSLYQVGQIYFEQQQYDQAIDFLEQGLKNLKEKTDEAYSYRYLLAECYELENKVKEAIHHWEKIAADNPGYRSIKAKLDSYRDILTNENLMTIFLKSLEELQPLIVEIISSLNYNIVSKERISSNEFQYKVFNIKRINEPPILIDFNRTTREIAENDILDFQKRINEEKCKSGIYIATSRFSLRARSTSASKMIELYDQEYVIRAIEKIAARKQIRK